MDAKMQALKEYITLLSKEQYALKHKTLVKDKEVQRTIEANRKALRYNFYMLRVMQVAN